MSKQRARRGVVAAASILGLTGALVAGCSSDDGGPQGPDGVTTVTFAASTFGDPGRGPKLIELLDEFNKSQSAVRVAAAAVPFPTFGQTVLTQMGSGLGPDLIRFDLP